MVSLEAAIVQDQVNGVYQTSEMEGNQLLVGEHVVYKGRMLCKVISVNRDKRVTLEVASKSTM